MKHLADPKYAGTLERIIALQLDDAFIYAGTIPQSSVPVYRLNGQSWDGLVERIASRIHERLSDVAPGQSLFPKPILPETDELI